MQRQVEAEVQILDRVMYLLEENSVKHLMESDQRFAEYIDQLYTQLEKKSATLLIADKAN